MKILVICTSVFTLPPQGYSGLEFLCARWAQLFAQAGHQVSVVCPEGSDLGEGIEIIPVPLGCPEEQAYLTYRERLGEWDACLDSTWQWFSVISQMESLRQLPIIHVYHSDYTNLHPGSRPPLQYPCLVGLSKDHAAGIAQRWGAAVKVVYNGIDLDFYQPASVERGSRYLWCARYTPEKAPLEAIHLARKTGVGLDLYGDTRIIANPDYLNRCIAECDSRQVVFHPGVPRHETVKLYRSHKALIHWVNYEEAFGLVPVEAQACGMPVIVNRRGALPEIVRHDETGFVVDTLEEAEELIKADAVTKIRPEDCRQQAAEFSIERSAKGYLRLFEDLNNGHFW